MRTWSVASLAILFLFGTATIILPIARGQEETESDGQTRLETLLVQRRDALAKAVELQMQQYRNGRCTLEAVRTLRRQLGEAELDAAQTPEDRVVVLQKQLALAKRDVALAKELSIVGRVTELDVLQANAAEMRVEIQLIREQGLVRPTD